ncbi:MAG: hypothetical protein UV51_C0010G0031 [Candidatus Woesebacteria bacterium GW2011_GWC1_42_9]|nr:MAG: hypothetical protein UV51_C0010G0031 [Candidatus Woesebacteria bacterium GW2011_GWC1_42_9]
MSKTAKIALLIAAAIIIPGGIVAGVGAYQLFRICTKVNYYKFNGIDVRYINLEFGIMVKNPGFINVDILGYNLDIFINGTKVASAVNSSTKRLSAKQRSNLVIPVLVDYTKSLGAVFSAQLLKFFANKQFDKIIVSIDGVMNARLLGVPSSIKINEKYSLREIQEIMDAPEQPC